MPRTPADSAPAWFFGDAACLAAWDGAGAAVWIGAQSDAAAVVVPTATDRADAATRAPDARPAFLRRRATLRLCVARWLAVRLEQVVVGDEAHGRPGLCEPVGFHLSGASRGGWQAVALSARPVGVDLDVLTGEPPLWDMLAEDERVRLLALGARDRPAAFLALWTAKEAVLKALGLGLGREPRDIAVESLAGGGLALRDRGRPMPLHAAGQRRFTQDGVVLQAACVVL